MIKEKDCHNCNHIELDVHEKPCDGCGEDREGWVKFVNSDSE